MDDKLEQVADACRRSIKVYSGFQSINNRTLSMI